MLLHVNVLQASDIPSVEFLGASNPFVTLKVSNLSAVQTTKVVENTLNPMWNQEFHFQLNPRNYGSIVGTVKSNQVGLNDIDLGTFTVPLSDFKVGEIRNAWYKITPTDNYKSNSEIELVIQIAPSNCLPFQEFPVNSLY